MPSEILLPVKGCFVKRRGTEKPLGQVKETCRNGSDSSQVKVHWGKGETEWLALDELESGFQRNWAVQDVPVSATRKPLGQGRVVGKRELGGRHQLLVQLDEDGRSVWLPYENLRRIKDARMRYDRTETGAHDHAERLRLRLLAYALENWNHLTGSLDRLEVDPLPHQIQLVHRILSSGNYNWLIADDVGLGKTIEVGLLLAALKRKGQARRVLVVSPAGLVRQWQDELRYKFAQESRIYGRDFNINEPGHWKLYDHVIVSIDLAKREDHMQMFRQAGGWDVIVFDEGHKLTRHDDGQRSDRYKLAEMLRPMADAFLLLSGTPHQGYKDRFMAILELVRPDLKSRIHTLEANPEIVGDMILRNRKSEVTDADGAFIFKGQKIHRVAVEPSEQTSEFQRRLNEYLKHGYRAGEAMGNVGRAIGFVMTTYRKLSSSSIAAIERGLQLRLDRLSQNVNGSDENDPADELTPDDLAEGGDDQDDLASRSTQATEFFDREREMLEKLIGSAKAVRSNDEKLRIFMEQVVAPLVREGRNLLVFTEYRATQSYLKKALEERFPAIGEVVLINGSMKLEKKLEAIKAFNQSARFMISTEAGGEGINLHESCHVMVNYDLPWNPARLVQRIGRLYRYGQSKTVVVFNLHARDTFDNKAIDLMMDRVSQIALDMAPVGPEFNERLHAEILGEVLDNLDLASILQSATEMRIEYTSAQIEEALDRAKRAKRLQDEIFTHVAGYDPNALSGTLGFTMQHVDVFIRGMLPLVGIKIEATLYDGAVKEIRLPEELRGRFPEFAQRTVVRITTDRRLAQRLPEVALLDFETSFFRFLIDQAKSKGFDGLYASTRSVAENDGVLVAFKLRWQNDQGEVLTEEFVPLFTDKNGNIKENPRFLAQWLVSPVQPANAPNPQTPDRSAAYDRLVAKANSLLAAQSTRFKHPNGLVELAAADFRSS